MVIGEVHLIISCCTRILKSCYYSQRSFSTKFHCLCYCLSPNMTGYAVCIQSYSFFCSYIYSNATACLLQITIMVEVAAHTIFEVLVLHLASDIKFMIGSTNILRRKQWVVASPFICIFFLELLVSDIRVLCVLDLFCFLRCSITDSWYSISPTCQTPCLCAPYKLKSHFKLDIFCRKL